jgi:plastocyanin
MMRRVAAVLIGLALALSLAGAALAATSRVKASGERWKPKHTYIGRADKVRFSNPTSKTHDIKAYGGGWSLSSVLSPGESVTRKFNKRGTYKYRCVRHSGIVGGTCQGMCGLVHVTG